MDGVKHNEAARMILRALYRNAADAFDDDAKVTTRDGDTVLRRCIIVYGHPKGGSEHVVARYRCAFGKYCFPVDYDEAIRRLRLTGQYDELKDVLYEVWGVTTEDRDAIRYA